MEMEIEAAVVTESVASKGTTLPDYINFLLSPDTPLDFHVSVGNPDICSQERIGAVKWMLIARSKVMRVMLLESTMRHEKEMSITDLDAATFKNFLTYMYGHDNTSSLQFEAAVALLCAAEKYDVGDLKQRLVDVITPQVTVDNVFVILGEALVCETVPELWEAATQTIQYQTEELFSHTRFPTVSPEVLLHIVQQESLSVPEIDVWRAALNWATHQAQPVEGVISAENLRLTVLPFLKHIRLCTLSFEHLIKDVMVTEILTAHEIKNISLTVAGNKESHSSDLICMETEEWGQVSLVSDKRLRTYTQSGTLNDSFTIGGVHLLIKDKDIELYAVECKTYYKVPTRMEPKGHTQEYNITVKISHISHRTVNNTHSEPEPTVEISFVKDLEYDTDFVIPLEHNHRNVVLKANNKYKMELTSDSQIQMYHHQSYYSSYEVTDSFDVLFIPRPHNSSFSPIKRLFYKQLNTK